MDEYAGQIKVNKEPIYSSERYETPKHNSIKRYGEEISLFFKLPNNQIANSLSGSHTPHIVLMQTTVVADEATREAYVPRGGRKACDGT